ncbi:MAG: tRNA threonylcarbamoyladenosine dehydratase [Clostridia bacterium]|jgi:tRNA A37 threonylcarbamoyladenosine dehydratase|nr:tRNA threonylcarbamoyladenosine dehydratase [Clostridia bacterium]
MDLSRSEMLLGKDGIARLKDCRVAVFGIGGVGSFAVEALARTGIGHIDLFDPDVISPSNINRQLVALSDNIGKYKVTVARERIHKINPECIVSEHKVFYGPENSSEYRLSNYDYIIDAIDTVTSKLELISKAKAVMVPIISSMGTGNKLNPQMLEIANITKTSVCPLSRVMRKELKNLGITNLKVVYSKEDPKKVDFLKDEKSGKIIPGSVSFVPSVAGLLLAAEVIKDLSKV